MKDIGIDLGTSSVLIYVKGKGIVLEEPSWVAVDKREGEPICIGREAWLMRGCAPPHVEIVSPMRDGVITHYDLSLKMLRYFLDRACPRRLLKPRVVICVPSGVTEVEGRAVHDAAVQAGARKTYLIEEPVAAALGAGMDISSGKGLFITDIGGGTTDIAVLSGGKIVVSDSVKVAGDEFDAAIVEYVRQKHNLHIGLKTAEAAKKAIGTVWQREDSPTYPAAGRRTGDGLPGQVVLSAPEMVDALESPITSIAEAVCKVIEKTPPELLADVTSGGILLTGGGSLLYGLDKLIENVTGIPTRRAEDPLRCVARGTGLALSHIADIPQGSLALARSRQQRKFVGA